MVELKIQALLAVNFCRKLLLLIRRNISENRRWHVTEESRKLDQFKDALFLKLKLPKFLAPLFGLLFQITNFLDTCFRKNKETVFFLDIQQKRYAGTYVEKEEFIA